MHACIPSSSCPLHYNAHSSSCHHYCNAHNSSSPHHRNAYSSSCPHHYNAHSSSCPHHCNAHVVVFFVTRNNCRVHTKAMPPARAPISRCVSCFYKYIEIAVQFDKRTEEDSVLHPCGRVTVKTGRNAKMKIIRKDLIDKPFLY